MLGRRCRRIGQWFISGTCPRFPIGGTKFIKKIPTIKHRHLPVLFFANNAFQGCGFGPLKVLFFLCNARIVLRLFKRTPSMRKNHHPRHRYVFLLYPNNKFITPICDTLSTNSALNIFKTTFHLIFLYHITGYQSTSRTQHNTGHRI